MQDQRSNSPTTEKLEQEIQILEEKVKKLQKEKSDSERLCNSALEESRITKENLKWYYDIKEELEKRYGIPVDDISQLGAIVDQVSQLFDYDASKVVYALSNLESLKEISNIDTRSKNRLLLSKPGKI